MRSSLVMITVLGVFMPCPLAQVTPPALEVFTLTPSTDHVVRGVTQNFSLECAFNHSLNPSQSTLSEISRIRILIADDGDQWKLIAEIRDNEVGVRLYDNIIGNGQVVGDVHSSYLRITWPTVTATTFGKYRCDVPGFDKNLDYVVVKSNILSVTESNMTSQNYFDLLVAQQNQFQQQVNTDIKLIDERLNSLNQSLGHKYEFWPEGTYSLLAPITGCPQSSEWRKGYFKIHTESGTPGNADEVPELSNLPPSTKFSDGGQNFMILTYCTKITSTPGVSWPSGSYCINRRGSCPVGFQSGYISLDTENTGHRSRYGGYHPDYTYKVHYFCCRSDGPASTPIDLPTTDPFFLYRYNGTCQSVANMHLTVESVTIDTEESGNSDATQNAYHPDGSLYPVIMQLCHYDPL